MSETPKLNPGEKAFLNLGNGNVLVVTRLEYTTHSVEIHANEEKCKDLFLYIEEGVGYTVH